MLETASILNHATSRSLVILDEIGRGTSTYDGLAIARSVAEFIHNHPRLGCKTLFATHYHELTQLAEVLPRVHNYNVAVAEEDGEVVFLHHIVPGGADRSYGVYVARLAGMPGAVVNRAWEVLKELEDGTKPVAANGRQNKRRTRASEPLPQQLPLLNSEHPVVKDLTSLDVSSMTPLEAINKLYEMQRRAKDVTE
jgi:DNA mismatch repair protein MutS